ncbi:hypothetical protein ABVK25_001178 [Lepraria finkii]|uniref:Uncharacterized protein n=1 Tax=Lepraria finkii TaxID=1340010 RepID=A0ABR4BL38_9LECA
MAQSSTSNPNSTCPNLHSSLSLLESSGLVSPLAGVNLVYRLLCSHGRQWHLTVVAVPLLEQQEKRRIADKGIASKAQKTKNLKKSKEARGLSRMETDLEIAT